MACAGYPHALLVLRTCRTCPCTQSLWLVNACSAACMLVFKAYTALPAKYCDASSWNAQLTPLLLPCVSRTSGLGRNSSCLLVPTHCQCIASPPLAPAAAYTGCYNTTKGLLWSLPVTPHNCMSRPHDVLFYRCCSAPLTPHCLRQVLPRCPQA